MQKKKSAKREKRRKKIKIKIESKKGSAHEPALAAQGLFILQVLQEDTFAGDRTAEHRELGAHLTRHATRALCDRRKLAFIRCTTSKFKSIEGNTR